MEVRLQADELERIYRNGIEGPAMARTQAAASPLAVYLGGQPGCGKSTLARSSAALFGSQNFIHIDVDRLRDLHPAYLPLVRDPQSESLAPSAVQRDCSQWADMLRAGSIAGRRNVLVDSTMRSPEQIRTSVLAHRAAGYTMEARILAVHARSSEVALSRRFEHEKAAMGYGRRMPLDYHELAADGIIDTVRAIENEKLFDRLVIFDRSGRTIYENELDSGAWRRLPAGAHLMEEFREASYDRSEKASIVALWDDVLDLMLARGASIAEMEAVECRRAAAKQAEESSIDDVDRRPIDADGAVARGLFYGRVLEIDINEGSMVQKIGRDPDRIARHALANLTRIPARGEVVEIRYQQGKGQVSEPSVVQHIAR